MANRQITHGVTKAELQLRKGQPFDALALELYHGNLARWGYSEADLPALGTLGSIVERTAKLNAIADLLFAGLMGAASLGQVEAFYTLERNYGHRVNQALQALYKLLELERERAGVLDYESILEGEHEHGDDSAD